MGSSKSWVPCMNPTLCGVKRHRPDTAAPCKATRVGQAGATVDRLTKPPVISTMWRDRARLGALAGSWSPQFTLHKNSATGVLQYRDMDSTKVNVEYKDDAVVLSRGGDTIAIPTTLEAEKLSAGVYEVNREIIKAYDALVERHPEQDDSEFPEPDDSNPFTPKRVPAQPSRWSRLRRRFMGR